MKGLKLWIGIGLAVLVAAFFYFRNSSSSAEEFEYRYGKVEKTELVRSTTASGVLVAQTSIDVRSKAGGTIVKLAVDAGSIVKKGDLIAIIDPRDTRALYDQAVADVQSSESRIRSASATLKLQRANTITNVQDARIALEQAKIRLAKAELEANRIPATTRASIASSQATVRSAQSDLDRFDQVTRPQRLRDAQAQRRQAETAFEVAKSDLDRQLELERRGYVAQSVVDRARSSYESARSAFETADQRVATLDQDLSAERISLANALTRAKAQLDESSAQGSQVQTAMRDLEEARQNVRASEVNLRKALDAQTNNEIRTADVTSAVAGAQRSRSQLRDAQVQMDSTTVLAPRDGVVTLKYAEEGTVIPPGVSQFSDRSNIVQLSDITRIFVDCAVDEADIGAIKEGQKTRVVTEAFPGVFLDGVVTRVNPAATTVNNITAITVRVEILNPLGQKIALRPGMNATCEFITVSKPNVLVVPSQAVKQEDGKAFVRVKGTDPKVPIRKEVTLGESGNAGMEVLSGLTENEEVVVAEINLKQLREMQQRMMEAQQGGGLAGGGQRMGTSRASTSGGSGGGMGGGSRGGGGMGGGGR